MQFFRPRLVHRQGCIEPSLVGFVASKQRNEVFLRHFALFNAQLHDNAFLGTHAIHHGAHAVYQVIELFRYQTELFEDFGQLQDFGCGISVATAFRFDGVTGFFVLCTQFGKFFARQLRIDAVVIVAAVIAIFVFIFVFIVVQLFLREFRTDVSRRRCQIFFRVRIDEASDQIRQASLLRFNTVILFQQIGNGFRVLGNGALNLVDPVFDTLSDVNFAFAGQQFNGTHFAHVHAHRIGCTTDFRFNTGKNLCSRFFCIFISVVGGFGKQ